MRMYNPVLRWFTADGKPLSLGSVYIYDPGTLNDKTTYSDAAMTVENTQPVLLDANGVPEEEIHFAGKARIRIYDTPTDAGTLQYDEDNVNDFAAGEYNEEDFTVDGTWTNPGIGRVYVLAVGAGGGGGTGGASSSGGGGGGGRITTGIYEVGVSTDLTISIGAGGATDADGGNTTVTGLTIGILGAKGGYDGTAVGSGNGGLPGTSGGGGGGAVSNGGNAAITDGVLTAAKPPLFMTLGGAGGNGTTGGAGGAGYIFGDVHYGCGGGGGGSTTGGQGGGSGTGGDGGSGAAAGDAAVAQTGSGGGGGGTSSSAGGAGSDGFVKIMWWTG